MSELDDRFKQAADKVKTLPQRPSNDELLELYALFKQGTEGDASGKRPGMFDLKGRAKYDAWTTKKGTDKAKAKEAYVAFVEKLVAQA